MVFCSRMVLGHIGLLFAYQFIYVMCSCFDWWRDISAATTCHLLRLGDNIVWIILYIVAGETEAERHLVRVRSLCKMHTCERGEHF